MTLQGQTEAKVQEARPSFVRRWLATIGLLRESKVAIIGVSLVLFWVLAALFAPVVARYDPNAQDFAALADPLPLGDAHLLGTDHLGRDMLSRLVWGARTVLTVAPIAVFVAYVFGCAIGMLAGYYRGWVDTLISRVSDIILSFPVLILYIILITTVGPSAFNIVVAVTLAFAPGIGRIVRGLALELRTNEYVAAAQIRGETGFYIMLIELLPNARGPLIVDACLRLGYTIITIGVLGFLGLGLPPPDPDWGGMVRETTTLMTIFPHMAVMPSVALCSLVIGFNLLADGLREISLRD
ncbi:MAG: ABC transporter permease [Alphaproteobacteria bacterium]|nr:ABC transporter permease [Alphaproteobacteria bacterium]